MKKKKKGELSAAGVGENVGGSGPGGEEIGSCDKYSVYDESCRRECT